MRQSLCCPSRSVARKKVRGVSLLFSSAATERAFAESRSSDLIATSCRLFVLFAGAGLPALCIKLFAAGESRLGTELFTIELAIMAAGCVFMVSVPVLAVTGVMRRRFSAAACEHIVVAMLTAILLIASLVEPHYIARICGRDEPVAHASDTGLLLKIDAIVTAAHIALPIRWGALLPLDATAVLVFTVFAFGLGSPERQKAPLHLLYLLLLVLGAIIGKRSVEKYERASFLNSLDEKTKRTMLEHELSIRREAQAAAAQHAPSTTPSQATGQIFGRASADGFGQIAKLGSEERWLLPDEALRLVPEHVLGRGSFGVVVAGFLHGTPVAVKVPGNLDDGGEPTARHYTALANELRVLRYLRSPHIVGFHGACIDVELGSLVLVEELLEGPRLDVFLAGSDGGGDSRSRPDDGARRCLVLGVCRGLRCLHAHDPCIVHGDLKPANVCVEGPSERPHVKLLDFGLSRLIKGTPGGLGGTLRWMAPEVIVGRAGGSAPPTPPGPAADIFSLGRLVYFIATGVQPLKNTPDKAIKEAAVVNRVPPLQWPARSSPFAFVCAPITEQCMSRDPIARPGIHIVHDDFFKLRLGGEEPNASSENVLDHPSKEHVPWQAGVQRVHAAMSHPRDASPLRPSDRPSSSRSTSEGRHDGPPRAAGTGPVYARFGLTPPITQQAMLLWCLEHWNWDVGSTHCCNYHAGIDSVRSVCDAMAASPCKDVLLREPLPSHQCANCLAVHRAGEDEEETECSVCDAPFRTEGGGSGPLP